MRNLCKVTIQLAGKYLVKDSTQPDIQIVFQTKPQYDGATWEAPAVYSGYYTSDDVDGILEQIEDQYVTSMDDWEAPNPAYRENPSSAPTASISAPNSIGDNPMREFYLTGVNNLDFRLIAVSAPKLWSYYKRKGMVVPSSPNGLMVLKEGHLVENLSLRIVES